MKNIFKNSGIRSLAQDQSSLLKRLTSIFQTPKDTFFTRKNTTYLSWSIAIFLQTKYGECCNVLISTDTRISGKWIKKKLIESMAQLGHTIFDADVVPTPFVAQTIKNNLSLFTQAPFFQLGIIITASHNPAEYNGIKVLTPDGYLTTEDEISITKIFSNILASRSQRFSQLPQITSKIDIASLYEEEIRKQLNPSIASSDMKIVLDCANGATSSIAKKIFNQYYSNITTINDDSDGTLINKNSGCSDPKLLIEAIQQHNADWGCAFDGDGDRVIIANYKGEVFDGDDILVALSQHPKFIDEKVFVGTIMTNNAIQQYFEQNDKIFIRTDVGERNIIQALQEHHAQLGSEACGHVTIMNNAYCSDGIFAALLFFETISSNSQILKNLPKKFTQIHANIPKHLISLNNKEIEEIVLKINAIILPGRIIARASNTEPVFRLTVEHPSHETALQIMNGIKQEIIIII